MVHPIRILLIGFSSDSPDTTSPSSLDGMIERVVFDESRDRFEGKSVSTIEDGTRRLIAGEFDCVVSNHDPPRIDGIDCLDTIRDRNPRIPVVLVTANGGERLASAAIGAGVTDYIPTVCIEDDEALASRLQAAFEPIHHSPYRGTLKHEPRALLERFSDPLFALDTDWRFTYANEAVEDIFEMASNRLIGKSIWELFPEAKQTPFYDHYREALEENEPRTIEDRFDPWDRWYREHLYPTEDGLTVVSHDITAEKRRERELDRYRDLHRHTEQQTAVGGWEVDAETDSQWWTDGTYRIHDLDPAGDFEPSIDAGLAFYHPEDRQTIETAVTRCLDHGEPYDLELRLYTDDGRLRWVETHGEPIVEDETIVGARGAIQDVTDRKRRADQLRDLSQFQEAVIESANVWINVLDEDGTVVLWNEAAAQISGYDADEVIGNNRIWEWLYPDPAYRESVMTLVTDILEGEKDVDGFETTITTNDGDERVIAWNSQQLTDESGSFSGSVAIGRDVTERKVTERQLRERVKELSAIQRTAQLSLESDRSVDELLAEFVDSLPQSFQYPDQTAIRLEYDESELTTNRYRSNNAGIRAAEQLRDGSTVSLEVVRLDGPFPPVDDPFLPEEADLIETLVTLVGNIIDRKRQKRRLQEQNRYLYRILDSMDDVFGIVDQDGVIRHYNETAREVWGYPETIDDEIPLTKFIWSRDADRIEQLFETVLKRDRARAELEIVTSDGEQVPYEFRLSTVENPDGETVIVGIGRDVSEIVERTNQLRVMDRVLRHNLRNDMSVIQGRADMIANDETASETATANASTIVEQSIQLMETVEKERTIIEYLAEPPERKPLDVVSMCRRILEHVAESYPNARIDFDGPSEAICFVTDELNRAVRELLVNAIEHNDRSTPEVTVTVSTHAETVRIAVADNGAAIPDEEVEILTRAREMDPLTHGSGLGLLLVHWVVVRSEGTVYFEENQPRGNVVTMYFPRGS